jgi:hypothetical protein
MNVARFYSRCQKPYTSWGGLLTVVVAVSSMRVLLGRCGPARPAKPGGTGGHHRQDDRLRPAPTTGNVERPHARRSGRADLRLADHPVARRRTEQELLVEPDVLGDHALGAEAAGSDRPAGRAVELCGVQQRRCQRQAA